MMNICYKQTTKSIKGVSFFWGIIFLIMVSAEMQAQIPAGGNGTLPGMNRRLSPRMLWRGEEARMNRNNVLNPRVPPAEREMIRNEGMTPEGNLSDPPRAPRFFPGENSERRIFRTLRQQREERNLQENSKETPPAFPGRDGMLLTPRQRRDLGDNSTQDGALRNIYNRNTARQAQRNPEVPVPPQGQNEMLPGRSVLQKYSMPVEEGVPGRRLSEMSGEEIGNLMDE
ncbi:MAG: hypothetical protein Q4C96_06245 [Planctomycetia bacterium]|nr:hypothetical protein [Planctomycetia bacterium]